MYFKEFEISGVLLKLKRCPRLGVFFISLTILPTPNTPHLCRGWVGWWWIWRFFWVFWILFLTFWCLLLYDWVGSFSGNFIIKMLHRLYKSRKLKERRLLFFMSKGEDACVSPLFLANLSTTYITEQPAKWWTQPHSYPKAAQWSHSP